MISRSIGEILKQYTVSLYASPAALASFCIVALWAENIICNFVTW